MSEIPAPPIWRDPQFRYYLSATGFTQFSFSMQQLLVAWLFVGVLATPPEQYGLAQLLIGIPGFALILLGGAQADRIDPRALLIKTYALAALPSLLLAAAVGAGYLSFWSVALWALAFSVCNSFAAPALQAVLSRVAGERVQQGVTMATIVGFLVQIAGLLLAGQMETLGIATVLCIQSTFILVGCALITRLAPMPPAWQQANESAPTTSTLTVIAEGIRATVRSKIILNTLLLNFISSVFNGTAFIVVFPYIVTRNYDGDAWFLSMMWVLFYAGATLSNLILLRFMPINRLGRLFLLLQLSRLVLLVLLWHEPSLPLLVAVIFLWGTNMGVTTTTSRTIVQQTADPGYRGRILSVFNLGALGALPLGALILGWCVALVGTLNALVPGMIISCLIFIYGVVGSGLWRFESNRPIEPTSTA